MVPQLLSKDYLVIEERLKGILSEVANSWSDITYLIFEMNDLKHEYVSLLIRTRMVESKVGLIVSSLDKQDEDLKGLKEELSNSWVFSECGASFCGDCCVSNHENCFEDVKQKEKTRVFETLFLRDSSAMSSTIDLDIVLEKNFVYENLLKELCDKIRM